MNFLDDFRDSFRLFEFRSVIDITLIAALIYGVLLPLRNTTAMSVLRGIGLVIVAVFLIARVLDLVVLNWLIERSVTGLLIGIPIIFQPELRRTLERVGRAGFGAWSARPSYQGVVEQIVEACTRIAAQRHGALIVLERDTGLGEYIDTGVKIDAALSAELLESLFFPNSPMHDGAVILREDRVVAAGCTLPLSEHAIPRHPGTRHRAALGVAERTDAVAIIVSEETADISVAAEGRITSDLSQGEFHELLKELVGRTRNERFVSTVLPPRRREPDSEAEAASQRAK